MRFPSSSRGANNPMFFWISSCLLGSVLVSPILALRFNSPDILSTCQQLQSVDGAEGPVIVKDSQEQADIISEGGSTISTEDQSQSAKVSTSGDSEAPSGSAVAGGVAPLLSWVPSHSLVSPHHSAEEDAPSTHALVAVFEAAVAKPGPGKSGGINMGPEEVQARFFQMQLESVIRKVAKNFEDSEFHILFLGAPAPKSTSSPAKPTSTFDLLFKTAACPPNVRRTYFVAPDTTVVGPNTEEIGVFKVDNGEFVTAERALMEMEKSGFSLAQKFDLIVSKSMLCRCSNCAKKGEEICGGFPDETEAISILGNFLKPGGRQFHMMQLGGDAPKAMLLASREWAIENHAAWDAFGFQSLETIASLQDRTVVGDAFLKTFLPVIKENREVNRAVVIGVGAVGSAE